MRKARPSAGPFHHQGKIIGPDPHGVCRTGWRDGYPVQLSLVETDEYVVFKVEPIDVTAAMITIERLPAIIAYSMEVAPPLFVRNRTPSLMRSFTDRLPDM